MTVVPSGISPRLKAVVDALPLRTGVNVLEVGCGPGAAAREVARRVAPGRVLGIDRSAAAIRQAMAGVHAEGDATGDVIFRHASVETFTLDAGEPPSDLAFAVRVGALDGRHPELQEQALKQIMAALVPGGRLFVDGGNPLREVPLER